MTSLHRFCARVVYLRGPLKLCNSEEPIRQCGLYYHTTKHTLAFLGTSLTFWGVLVSKRPEFQAVSVWTCVFFFFFFLLFTGGRKVWGWGRPAKNECKNGCRERGLRAIECQREMAGKSKVRKNLLLSNYGHTQLNPPHPVRSAQLNSWWQSQYYGGGPHGNTLCCSFFTFFYFFFIFFYFFLFINYLHRCCTLYAVNRLGGNP
jgi:hypothetical protein